MKQVILYFATILFASLYSCSEAKNDAAIKIPPFPYQAYLDSIGEDNPFPVIGDDGEGFNAISHNIRYPEMPDSLSSSQFADSLLQYYNAIIAFNTIAYDIGTAERYMGDQDFVSEYANALDSVNTSGIHHQEIANTLVEIGHKSAEWLKSGKRPNEQDNKAVASFYERFNKIFDQFIKNHNSEAEYSPSDILENYNEIHSKAVNDTTLIRVELLRRVLQEQDFEKKCVLAREFAYANYKSPYRDDKELVAVIDPILRANTYSPLLYDLWLIWRTALQMDIIGGPSNDSAIYNLFYNDMRNRVAIVYIAHLNSHPNDDIAFAGFWQIAAAYNITRNSPLPFGNNSMMDDMYIYDEVWNKKADGK